MMYFWVIPVLLLAIIALAFLFRNSKRPVQGRSRLDEAMDEVNRDLRK